MSGLELQQRLKAEDCALPVVIMTGHGSVEAAREAFRSNAIDFLEKPLDHGRLVTAIDEALHQAVGKFENQQRRDDLERQLAVLTPREREVMGRVVAGEHNRDIAKALNISPRTVEVHKGRMMSKLGVSSVPDLVKLNLGHGPIR